MRPTDEDEDRQQGQQQERCSEGSGTSHAGASHDDERPLDAASRFRPGVGRRARSRRCGSNPATRAALRSEEDAAPTVTVIVISSCRRRVGPIDHPDGQLGAPDVLARVRWSHTRTPVAGIEHGPGWPISRQLEPGRLGGEVRVVGMEGSV